LIVATSYAFLCLFCRQIADIDSFVDTAVDVVVDLVDGDTWFKSPYSNHPSTAVNGRTLLQGCVRFYFFHEVAKFRRL